MLARERGSTHVLGLEVHLCAWFAPNDLCT